MTRSKVQASGEATKGPKKPPNAGKGRKKGVQNKVTKALKEMILGALEDAGGQDYLARQAVLNPGPFMALVGKVLPAEIKAEHTGKDGDPLTVVIRKPE